VGYAVRSGSGMPVDDWAALPYRLDSGVGPELVCPFDHVLSGDVARLAGCAAPALEDVCFQTEVEPTAGGEWLLVVYAYHCPRADELERRIAFLEQIADSFGGEYDGWGVPVKR